jgi:hypothetical protein
LIDGAFDGAFDGELEPDGWLDGDPLGSLEGEPDGWLDAEPLGALEGVVEAGEDDLRVLRGAWAGPMVVGAVRIIAIVIILGGLHFPPIPFPPHLLAAFPMRSRDASPLADEANRDGTMGTMARRAQVDEAIFILLFAGVKGRLFLEKGPVSCTRT